MLSKFVQTFTSITPVTTPKLTDETVLCLASGFDHRKIWPCILPRNTVNTRLIFKLININFVRPRTIGDDDVTIPLPGIWLDGPGQFWRNEWSMFVFIGLLGSMQKNIVLKIKSYMDYRELLMIVLSLLGRLVHGNPCVVLQIPASVWIARRLLNLMDWYLRMICICVIASSTQLLWNISQQWLNITHNSSI